MKKQFKEVSRSCHGLCKNVLCRERCNRGTACGMRYLRRKRLGLSTHLKCHHNMITRILCSCLCSLLLSSSVYAQPFFSTKGTSIIGVDGKPFQIKGTNLGNWLVPEGYMFLFKDATSPRLINQTLTELVGPEKAKVFWRKYLETYITAEDIHYLKSIGMNSIRVPFNYRLFTTENYMGDNDSTHGFKILDRLLGWCRKEKLY